MAKSRVCAGYVGIVYTMLFLIENYNLDDISRDMSTPFCPVTQKKTAAGNSRQSYYSCNVTPNKSDCKNKVNLRPRIHVLYTHTVPLCGWYDNGFQGDGATGLCGSHLLPRLCAQCVHADTHQVYLCNHRHTEAHTHNQRAGWKKTDTSDCFVVLKITSVSPHLTVFTFT